MSVARSSYLKNTTGGAFVDQTQGGTVLGQELALKDSATSKDFSLKQNSSTAKIVSGGEFGRMRRGKFSIFGSIDNLAGLISAILARLGNTSVSSSFVASRHTTKVVPVFEFIITPDKYSIALDLIYGNDYIRTGACAAIVGLDPNGSYNFTIDWGDGTTETVTEYRQLSKVYGNTQDGYINSDKTIKIKGRFNGLRIGDSGNAIAPGIGSRLKSVVDWGKFEITGDYSMNQTYNLTSCPVVTLKASGDMHHSLTYAATTNGEDVYNLISLLDTTNVTKLFNFLNSDSSDGSFLSNWDVSNVTDMSNAFQTCNDFTTIDLSSWDVSKVTNMAGMFLTWRGASVLNIAGWDVSSVTTMADMFMDFFFVSNFNEDISGWNTASLQDVSGMFAQGAAVGGGFNQPIGSWNTSNITTTKEMFWNNGGFNQPLNNWDTSSLTNCFRMFLNANSFNQPLNNWDTSNVTNFGVMFASQTTHAFDQDLSSWDFTGITDINGLSYFGYGCNFSPANYDALLATWASQAANMPTGIDMQMGTSRYTAAGATHRSTLINSYNWTFTDGGQI